MTATNVCHCGADTMAPLCWWGRGSIRVITVFCLIRCRCVHLLRAAVACQPTHHQQLNTHYFCSFFPLILLMREVMRGWLLFIPSCIRWLWAAEFLSSIVCLEVVLSHPSFVSHTHVHHFSLFFFFKYTWQNQGNFQIHIQSLREWFITDIKTQLSSVIIFIF